ncbi:MAG: PAS domain S-box protein [Spirochaetes bacterium]|nr:PAS domain S-box protein [Spirochaetota bacterium]
MRTISAMNNKIKHLFIILFCLIIVLILYFVSINNYLLFHSLVEIFGIIIACVIFTIAWNLRDRISNNYILFLGFAFLFVAVTGIIHTLAYKGMNLFTKHPGANLATQMWIAARYMESITLLIAPFFAGRKIRESVIIPAYSIVTAFILLSVFYLNIFPVCFDDSSGLTSFKKISEYLISLIFLFSIFTLLRRKKYFERKILNLLLCAITFKILSELSFTEYTSVYDFINFTGHIFAVISYFFIYAALISTVLTKPFDLIFRDLQNKNTECASEIGFVRAVIDAADVLVVVVDRNARIMLFNKTCEQMSGYTLPELHGRPYWEFFIIHDELEKVKANFKALISGSFPDMNTNYWKMKDGSLRLISWSKTALMDEKNIVEYIVAVGRDITDITNLQSENKNIVSMIAHDMKSPLLSVQLFSNQLIKKWHKLDDAKINEYLTIIHKEGDKLNSLIDEFLEFSLMRHGLIFLDLKPVNPCALINELLSVYSIRAKENNITIKSDCSFDNEIFCDESRLNRVLTNLLDNAIKFSGENTVITIRTHKDKDSLKIEIQDSGIGIADDDVHNIFHPFIRGKQASEKSGYGVGLAYVKTVVEKHNGSISVKSRLGKGTTFTILLPLIENDNNDFVSAGSEPAKTG